MLRQSGKQFNLVGGNLVPRGEKPWERGWVGGREQDGVSFKAPTF